MRILSRIPFLSLLAAVFAAPALAQPEWVARTSGQTRALNAVAWTGTLLAVVGDNGVVSTSPDGVQWTRRSSGSNRALRGVAGQGSLLVAVGDNGTILRSSNGGASWESRDPGTSRTFYGVARAPGFFVAVGSQGTLYTSPDGLEWTSRPTNTSTDLNAVAWNGSVIVAVGDNGLIRTSTDGIEWADRSVNTSGDDVDAVAWAGSQFIALGENGIMLQSPDGWAWTSSRAGPGTVLGAAWDGARLVAVGTGGSAWTSPDGNAWTSSRPGTSQALRAVTWTGARLVAVGGNGVLFTADVVAPPPAEPPQAPILTFPAPFASDIPVQTELRWSATASAALYRIQVSRGPDFSDLVLEDSTSSLSLDVALQGSTEYFWRVRAWNVVGNGPWSEIRAFRTVVTVPSAPQLSYPAQYAENVPLPVTLRWERVAGATSYRLEISRSPDFASLGPRPTRSPTPSGPQGPWKGTLRTTTGACGP